MIILRNKFFSIDSDASIGNGVIMNGSLGLGLIGGLKYSNWKDKKYLDKLENEYKIKGEEGNKVIQEEYEKAVEEFNKNKENIKSSAANKLKKDNTKIDITVDKDGKVNIKNIIKDNILNGDGESKEVEEDVLKRFKNIRDKKKSNLLIDNSMELSDLKDKFNKKKLSRLIKRSKRGLAIGAVTSLPLMYAYEKTKDKDDIKEKRNKQIDSVINGNMLPGIGSQIGLMYSIKNMNPTKELMDEINFRLKNPNPKKSQILARHIKHTSKFLYPSVIGAGIGYLTKKSIQSINKENKEVKKIRERIKDNELKLEKLKNNK